MRMFQVVVIAVIAMLLGVAGGYLFYANTVARYAVTSSACVAMQEAVAHHMLTMEQVRELGAATGKTLQRNYSAVANQMNVPQEGLNQASPDSVCSQFLLGINSAR